ncbi:hypothetical protein [Deinococcus peraridilitoris]|uniref:hypothetical protein n=1 Tax=Deinococcus peraridilitoris TaxID=432329 RepID=UPI000313BD84|nr:hypothetical protein [Deinococcus peraridilitoris]
MATSTPRLLNVERQGLTVVLHVRDQHGQQSQVRCGQGESLNPRNWQWSRNSLAAFVRDDPQAYVSFTDGGRQHRFAVSTEEQLLQFKRILNSPVA